MANLEIGIDGGVAHVRLNRPDARNAITLQMWRDLANVFAEFDTDDRVRSVVLSGEGKDFSVGADVSEFDAIRDNRRDAARYELSVDACSNSIADLRKPVIAAVSGYCLGGGCHLALACDFRFAAPSAVFGIPAANLSIVYGVRSVQRLLALVGVASAKRVLFTASRFDAHASQGVGLVDEIADDCLASALSFAKSMTSLAPLSIAGAKYMLNGLSMGLGALDFETAQRLVDEASDSEDFREGRRAFAEKRAPSFHGV